MDSSAVLLRSVMAHAAIVIGTMSCSQGPGHDAVAQTSAAASYAVGAAPRAIALADLNDDGYLDVVVANSGDGTLTLLLGTSSGLLAPAGSILPAGNEPGDVDAIDLDNDGDIDLVVANHETSLISVLLNDGQAGFAAAARSPFDTGAQPHHHGLATGDFDGDGWNDVAVDSSGGDDVRLLTGGQHGLSEAISIPVGTMPYYRLGAADVTNDGRVDILTPGHGDNTVRIMHREGPHSSTTNSALPLSGKPWMVVGDDFNGDQRTDIAAVLTDAVDVWLGGSSSFSPAPGSPYPIQGATEIAAGDIDGDGIADLAVGPWDGLEVTIITGGEFSVRMVRACERPIGLAVADLDGDGRGEVLAACATENRLIVLNLAS